MNDTQKLEKLLKKYILDQDISKKIPTSPRKPCKKKTQRLTKRKPKD